LFQPDKIESFGVKIDLIVVKCQTHFYPSAECRFQGFKDKRMGKPTNGNGELVTRLVYKTDNNGGAVLEFGLHKKRRLKIDGAKVGEIMGFG
jgi:hypothetical protein